MSNGIKVFYCHISSREHPTPSITVVAAAPAPEQKVMSFQKCNLYYKIQWELATIKVVSFFYYYYSSPIYPRRILNVQGICWDSQIFNILLQLLRFNQPVGLQTLEELRKIPTLFVIKNIYLIKSPEVVFRSPPKKAKEIYLKLNSI